MNFYNKIDESTTFQQLDGNSNKTDKLTISQQDAAGFYFIISFLIILILPFLCLILKIIECILSIILLFVESFIIRKCSSQKESKQVLTKFYKELKNKKPMLYKFIKFTQEGLNPSSSILPIPRGNGSGRSHSFGGGGGFGGGGAGRRW